MCLTGNWEGAEDVLRRMNRIKEMEPNVITYSSVINAYANKGNWQGAENVLRRMQYQGVQPNIITYNSLITAYAKEGNWQVRRGSLAGTEREGSRFFPLAVPDVGLARRSCVSRVPRTCSVACTQTPMWSPTSPPTTSSSMPTPTRATGRCVDGANLCVRR